MAHNCSCGARNSSRNVTPSHIPSVVREIISSSLLNFLRFGLAQFNCSCGTAVHIPGRLNTGADEKSRVSSDNHEWMLNTHSFNEILLRHPGLDFDLFASRLNNQISTWCRNVSNIMLHATMFGYLGQASDSIHGVHWACQSAVWRHIFTIFNNSHNLSSRREGKGEGLLKITSWPGKKALLQTRCLKERWRGFSVLFFYTNFIFSEETDTR